MNRVDQITKGFLSYLKRTNQLGLLPQLAQRHLREAKLKVDPNLAQISTAIPLAPADLDQLEAVLSDIFKSPNNL